MHILLLNQFYPPDVAPTGQVLHDLARTLVERGHRVTVFCSRRSYNGGQSFPGSETLDGVEIRRVLAFGFGRGGTPGKLLDYASFYGFLALNLFFPGEKPGLILSLTTPPYLGVLGRMAAKFWGCRHAHWIMDLYPDVMAAHGMMSSDKWVYRTLARLAAEQFSDASLVLAIGNQMARRLEPYLPARRPAELLRAIPLWADPALIPWPVNAPNPMRVQRGWKDDELVLMYSGNMGLGHRFSEFLAAAGELGVNGPRWVFAGAGPRLAEIDNFKPGCSTRIEILPYVPRADLRASLCSADVLLASLDARWEGLILPSKLQSIFAVGKPILCVGSESGELARWVIESGGGWIVPENNIPALHRAIEQAQNPGERASRGIAARAFAEKHFNMKANCGLIAEWAESSP